MVLPNLTLQVVILTTVASTLPILPSYKQLVYMCVYYLQPHYAILPTVCVCVYVLLATPCHPTNCVCALLAPPCHPTNSVCVCVLLAPPCHPTNNVCVCVYYQPHHVILPTVSVCSTSPTMSSYQQLECVPQAPPCHPTNSQCTCVCFSSPTMPSYQQ